LIAGYYAHLGSSELLGLTFGLGLLCGLGRSLTVVDYRRLVVWLHWYLGVALIWLGLDLVSVSVSVSVSVGSVYSCLTGLWYPGLLLLFPVSTAVVLVEVFLLLLFRLERCLYLILLSQRCLRLVLVCCSDQSFQLEQL
jgi:hypothetical protein